MRVFEHVLPAVFAGGLTAMSSLSALPRAAAQSATGNALTGVWRAGSTQIDVVVESWGVDCGPRPQSSSSGGGGTVNINQSGGQLVIHGRGQDIRSDACWSRNPSIKRQATGFAGGAWTTKCRTAANDPREESGTYTLRIVGPDTLTYRDVSRYNWALNQSRCVATFTTMQTLTRRNSKADAQAIAAEQAAKQPPKPVTDVTPPEPEEKETACTPGVPKRMVLRPRRAEIEVGQRVCFRPRIVDDADCVIRDPSVQWSLSHSKALRGTLVNGCFTAASTAADAEGDFKIVATLGSLRSEATVSVHPVDLSALIAKRMGSGALTGFEDEAPALPATPKSVTRVASRHEPEVSTSPRKLVGIVLGVAATGLALAALWLSRRKVPVTSPSVPPPVVKVPSSMPPPLPPRPPAAHTRAEVVPSPPLPAPPPPTAAPVPHVVDDPARPMSSGPPPSEAWICPMCRVGYPAYQQTCPKDGTALMPYADFTRSRKRTEEERKKRCPKCGSVFPSHASFCAEDGTQLVDA